MKRNYLLKLLFAAIVPFFVACTSNEDNTSPNDNGGNSSGISQEAKDRGLSVVAVNQDANSSEICYVVKENGDSITFIGNKDENGCTSNIYLMKYVSATERLSTRFDEQMRPVLLTYNNNVEISFDWIDEKSALIKAFDPETNTYISTVWNSEQTPQASQAKTRYTIASPNVRTGDMRLAIIDRQPNKLPLTRTGEPVDELSDQNCIFTVTQCEYPKDALTWIGLYNANTHKLIENIDYYKRSSTGVYLYKIPAGSYPSQATYQQLCQRIDYALEGLKTGFKWMLGFESVADAVVLVSTSLGMGIPPAAIIKAITMATVAGAVGLEVFLDANGTQGLMSTFFPDLYYREYVVSDMILSPHVITSTVIDCERQVITPQTKNIRINCDIDGEPTIDSFILDPSFPARGQNYVASATFHCVPIGSTITMSIVGTDGYTDSRTTTVDTTSGIANLYVPGAATGVKDVCTVVLTPTTGEPITMTASLMFGY